MSNRTQTVLRWTAAAVVVASLLMIMQALPSDQLRRLIEQGLDRLGWWGPAAFIALYAVATVCFVPGSILTLAAGAVFGLLSGLVWASAGATLGAALAFLVARYLARDTVAGLARRHRRFSAIDSAISEGGWRIVALLRLSPVIPFNLQNYLYGLTDLRFWPYVLTSWVAMLPGAFLYVYLGHTASAAATAEGGSLGRWTLLILGLVATVALTVYLTRLARRALADQSDLEPDTTTDEGQETAPSVPASLALVAVALLSVGAAVVAHWQSDRLAESVRTLAGMPQRVAMTESYADDSPGPQVDHGSWQQVLDDHVDAAGWVDYQGLADDSSDLDAYIRLLAEVPFDHLGRDAKLATLINAYNACTLRLILDHYPVASIKDIPTAERWQAERWQIGNHTWSLDQIEHQQIRPNFAEPRIHFVLVCAAAACPPLAQEAYVGERIEEQLAVRTDYVHTHATWLQFDQDTATLALTPLYDWYRDDFLQFADSLPDYVSRYVPAVASALADDREISVDFLPYDWSLNSQANAAPR